MIDAATIERTLTTIVGRGNVCEIRALGVDNRDNRTDAGYFDDFAAAAKAITPYAENTKGVYFVLNPIDSSLLARSANKIKRFASLTTSDKDVTSRRWLYVDCDAFRKSGISSSDLERDKALERAEEIRDWMMELGMFEPITAMSGNGAHLLFPIDLPNNDESLKLVKDVLSVLSEKFSDNLVDVDESVCNAARICRLYGTPARKGDSIPDRPHRVSQLLHVPDYLENGGFEAIPASMLQAIANMLPKPEVKAKPAFNGNGQQESRLMVPQFLRRLGMEFTEAASGEYQKFQIDCPFDPNHKKPDAYMALHSSGAIVFHCSHNSCSHQNWQTFRDTIARPEPDDFDPPLPARRISDQPPAQQKPPPPKTNGAPKPTQAVTTLKQASLDFAASMSQPELQLMTLGLGELDYAIGGGIAQGEMVLMAARPSHGKSLVALQIVHSMTADGVPCCFMSEEMSSVALGKRTAQFATVTTESEWRKQPEQFKQDLGVHFSRRAECYIMESSRTAEKMCENIRRLHGEHGVRCAVVDYAQLLQGKGNSRYEQVTNTSIALRHLATEIGISLVVLCQMNRSIEGRAAFIPQMGDLKDSGQLEQDADVLVYLVWPHRLNHEKPEDEYLMFVSKNRNREIKRGLVKCHIDPSRQKIGAAARDWENAADAFS